MRKRSTTKDSQRANVLETSEKCDGKKDSAICSPGDSHANRIALPGRERQAETNETCGRNVSGPYAEYDQATHSLRTYQGCLPLSEGDSSTECLRTWQVSGMMRNGRLYQRAPLVRHTHGTECGSLPTLIAGDASDRRFSINSRGEPKLSAAAKLLANGIIPEVRAYTRQEIDGLDHRRKLHPDFAEWLMGYPTGWSDCER